MPVNLHNLLALAQEFGNDRIPRLLQYLSEMLCRDVRL